GLLDGARATSIDSALLDRRGDAVDRSQSQKRSRVVILASNILSDNALGDTPFEQGPQRLDHDASSSLERITKRRRAESSPLIQSVAGASPGKNSTRDKQRLLRQEHAVATPPSRSSSKASRASSVVSSRKADSVASRSSVRGSAGRIVT
ncbi:unnamed protein product, partial [Amoebophrya sp. A25]